MKKYRVVLKGNFKKELIIDAENIDEGAELIEQIYAKTKLLKFKQKEIENLTLELEEIGKNKDNLQKEKSNQNSEMKEDYEDKEQVTLKEYNNDETGEIHYSMRCPKCNQEISVDNVVEEVVSQALGEY